MLILILYAIGVFFIIHGLYQIYKYFIVVFKLKNEVNSKILIKNNHKFFVFIPVLHEENNIENLLNNLLPQEYPEELYKIFIITTQREHLNKSNPNTIDILNKIKIANKQWNKNLIHLHYPKVSGFKAEQLSFAFNYVYEESKSEISNIFFLLLDGDSLVDKNIISKFNQKIEEDFDLYQQPLLWFKNIGEIRSPLMKSFSFLQSFFSISYEIPMFIGKFFPLRLKYLIGNGLLIKGSFLLKIKNFPPIIEDVRLGRLASFLEAKIKIVPNFIITETAKNFLIQSKQSSVWFFGCGLFLNDYLCALKISNKKRMKDYMMIMYAFFKAFRWANKGLLQAIGLILSVIILNKNLILLYCMSISLNSIIPVILVLFSLFNEWNTRVIDRRKVPNIIFQAVICSPLIYVLGFIGTYLGLFRLIKYYACKKVTLPKTER